MDDLAELQREHQRNHGPCGCLQPGQCPSARYLAIIERQQAVQAALELSMAEVMSLAKKQQADLARLEQRRARLYKRLRENALGEHRAFRNHNQPFEKCDAVGCRDAYWSLRMGRPIRD